MADQYKQIGDLDVVDSLSNGDKFVVETVAGTRAVTNATLKGSVTKQSIGLGNVDNTSDANKPISTATQNALDEITNNLENNYLTRSSASGTYLSKADALDTYVQPNDLAEVATSGSFNDLIDQPSSINNYLPNGTVITVGTGKQFTSIQSAYNSLQNKWSDGTVTIKIDAGTYTNKLVFDKLINIPDLVIEGSLSLGDVATRIEYTPSANNEFVISLDNQKITFKYLIVSSNSTQNISGIKLDIHSELTLIGTTVGSAKQYGLYVLNNSIARIIKYVQSSRTYICGFGGKSSSNCSIGVFSTLGGSCRIEGDMSCYNCGTGLNATLGGMNIINSGVSVNFSSVNTQYSPTTNTNTTSQTGWNFKA